MKAIVNTAVCPLKAEPKWECTLVDEVLYGMVVDILEEPAPAGGRDDLVVEFLGHLVNGS